MPKPRAFKLRQAENRPSNHIGTLPRIDRKRATAILVRQSKDGADTAQAESRETQLGLQDYGKLLYGEDEPIVLLYDEGAGVSGQKRIDQRKELDRLYQDIHKGIIGTIVLAREDRLFRNKHMDQVGTFTKLAEEKQIQLIVPPISSVAHYDETRIYDFTVYQEEAIMRRYYPHASRWDMLQLLPDRTWRALQRHASYKHIERAYPAREDIPPSLVIKILSRIWTDSISSGITQPRCIMLQ